MACIAAAIATTIHLVAGQGHVDAFPYRWQKPSHFASWDPPSTNGCGLNVAEFVVATESFEPFRDINSATESRADEDTRDLVKQLGAREFVTREQATQALWKLGPQVESELVLALQTGDRETIARARLILDRFRHGIFPNTPADVVNLIEQYRTGDKNVRAQVLRQLVVRGQVTTVERLVDLAASEDERQEVADWILGRFDETLAPLILNNQLDAVERTLFSVAYDEEDIAMCTAALRHRGRLDEGIAWVQSRIQQIESRNVEENRNEDTSRERRMLIAFYHALGDDKTAGSLLSEYPQKPETIRDYHIASGDWQAWSDWEANQLANNQQPPSLELAQLEPLSFAAFAHHLAGNDAQRDRVLQDIRALSEKNEAARLFAAECLFATDRPTEAIEMLTKREPMDGFSILCQQHDYEGAFAILGMTLENDSITAWIDSRLNDENLTTQEGQLKLYNGLDVCAQLAMMGRTELAKRNYEQLADFVLGSDSPQPWLLREICRQEFLLGFDDLAWGQMERLFQTPRFKKQEVLRNDFGTRALFPQDYVLSTFWWKAIATQESDTLKRLKLIKGVLETYVENDTVPAHFQSALDSALAMIAHAPEQQRVRDYSMLADTCMRANLRSLAKKYYEQAFDLGDGNSGVKIGDILREANETRAAAEWYGKAYQLRPDFTWALYLQGVCLEQSGDAKRGRELQEQGRLLSLQSPRALQLADALHLREMTEPAVSVWESVVATTTPLSSSYCDACERLGSVLAETNPGRAAIAWRQVFISVMGLNRNFSSRTVYLSTAERIHRMEAFAFLDAGDLDSARNKIELCRMFEPGSSEIPEFLVPRLEAAGAQADADELFEAYFDHYEELLTLLPDSALHHNNLAWFSARCERRIDDALRHARRAVEIEPTSSNYLDTLAEIEFLKGNPREAADLARRCIEINPIKAHYREQLARFETAMKKP